MRNRHGFTYDEAMSSDANPANSDGSHYFIGSGFETDWSEKAALDALDAYKAAHPEENLNGKRMTVARRDRVRPSGDG